MGNHLFNRVYNVFVVYICTYVGILCGSCKERNGVSTLLNNCVSCINVGWLLIIILGMYVYHFNACFKIYIVKGSKTN